MFDTITGVRESDGQIPEPPILEPADPPPNEPSSFHFTEMNVADGPITGKAGSMYSRLYIQEGAIVEITCKSNKASRESEYTDGNWFGADDSQSFTTRVDSDIFEITDNFEKYHSTDVHDSTSLGTYIKFVSSLRYTGRLEDNGKYLQCRTADSSKAVRTGPNNAAVIVLIVRRKFHHR